MFHYFWRVFLRQHISHQRNHPTKLIVTETWRMTWHPRGAWPTIQLCFFFVLSLKKKEGERVTKMRWSDVCLLYGHCGEDLPGSVLSVTQRRQLRQIPTDKVLLQQNNTVQGKFILTATMQQIAICTVQSDINSCLWSKYQHRQGLIEKCISKSQGW